MTKKIAPAQAASAKRAWATAAAVEARMLADALLAAGVSATQLADRVGLSRARVERMANDDVPAAAVPLRIVWLAGEAGEALLQSAARLRAKQRDHFGPDALGRLAALTARLHQVIDGYAELLTGADFVRSRRTLLRRIAAARASLAGLEDALSRPDDEES